MNGFEALVSLGGDALSALTSSAGYGIAKWFLIGVFFISGTAKMRKPLLVAMAMVDFRVARRAQPMLAVALGMFELTLAVGLASDMAPAASMATAAIVLWTFCIIIARSLWAGDSFPCMCLGDAESTLSSWTLARTGALASLASVQAMTVQVTASGGVGRDDVLEAIAGLSLVGAALLAGRMPRLLRWNASTARMLRTGLA